MNSAAMIQAIKDGATEVHAATHDDYEVCADWICENGGKFSYHFEVGEGFKFEGRQIEVWGL